jgi:hypothetical protein
LGKNQYDNEYFHLLIIASIHPAFSREEQNEFENNAKSIQKKFQSINLNINNNNFSSHHDYNINDENDFDEGFCSHPLNTSTRHLTTNPPVSHFFSAPPKIESYSNNNTNSSEDCDENEDDDDNDNDDKNEDYQYDDYNNSQNKDKVSCSFNENNNNRNGLNTPTGHRTTKPSVSQCFSAPPKIESNLNNNTISSEDCDKTIIKRKPMNLNEFHITVIKEAGGDQSNKALVQFVQGN